MVSKTDKARKRERGRIVPNVIDDAHMPVDDATSIKTSRLQRNLKELLSKVPSESAGAQEDWGVPQGKEIW